MKYLNNEESAQTRRKHCALAVVRRSQNFIAPLQTPFPGARDGQNLISWRWSLPLPAPLYLQTQFGEDKCMQFQDIVVINPPTYPQTGPITIHCAAASAQCNSNLTVHQL